MNDADLFFVLRTLREQAGGVRTSGLESDDAKIEAFILVVTHFFAMRAMNSLRKKALVCVSQKKAAMKNRVRRLYNLASHVVSQILEPNLSFSRAELVARHEACPAPFHFEKRRSPSAGF